MEEKFPKRIIDDFNSGLPSNWELRRLNELCKIKIGGTPKTNIKSFWNGSIKWATAKDISNTSGRFIQNTEKNITKEGSDRSAAKILPTNTIVITARGTVGKMAITPEPMAINQTCYGLLAENIDSMFLYYSVKSALEKLMVVSYGTVFDTITIKSFEDINLPVPSKRTDQRAIAKILSDLDSKIELNQKMNKTLESIAQAIFKHWFIDFEFPSEEGKPYKSSGEGMVNSELEGLPKNWTIKKLDEIANFLNGLALQKFPAISENDYLPVIKIKEMNSGVSDSSDKASRDIPSEYVVHSGDILFAWSGSLGVTIWCNGEGALNQHIFKVTSNEYPKWFYYEWILHYLPGFIEIARDKVTTMGHIQRYHLSESLVTVPDVNTLKIMNSVLKPIIDRIINLNVESDTLTRIRDLLLPIIISGKIRVPMEE